MVRRRNVVGDDDVRQRVAAEKSEKHTSDETSLVRERADCRPTIGALASLPPACIIAAPSCADQPPAIDGETTITGGGARQNALRSRRGGRRFSPIGEKSRVGLGGKSRVLAPRAAQNKARRGGTIPFLRLRFFFFSSFDLPPAGGDESCPPSSSATMTTTAEKTTKGATRKQWLQRRLHC